MNATKQLYREQLTPSIGNSDTVLAPANARRIALVVSPPQNNRLTISFNGAVTTGAGIVIYPKTSPLILLYEHIGQAIREEIHAMVDTTGETIGVLDVFETNCPCSDYEAATPKQQQRQPARGLTYGR